MLTVKLHIYATLYLPCKSEAGADNDVEPELIPLRHGKLENQDAIMPEHSFKLNVSHC